MAVNEPGPPSDVGVYCREIEAYLCRQNGGHLIRIVGPAFQKVNSWLENGMPLKIVFRGIDRRVKRHSAGGGQRRPLRIEFCEADVLDVFDEWKRAVGTMAQLANQEPGDQQSGDALEHRQLRRASLPAHLQRVHVTLTSLLASQRLPETLSRVAEDVTHRIDGWHRHARAARGESRRRLLEELRAADAELVNCAWDTQDASALTALRRDAAQELSAFRSRMTPETWQASVDAAARRLLRERLALPTLALD